MASDLLGAIEAGGTKFVLATGTASGEILARQEIPTRDPHSTLAAAQDWFAGQGEIAALGIASFGPVELDRSAPKWGFITETPKPSWANCDVAGSFASHNAIPIGFDTDVNGAALAEYRLGAGQQPDRSPAGLAYATIGTGIGGGLVLGGQLVHGAGHPELGHIFTKRPAHDTDYAGQCPFHGDCLEGLASGPAIIDRWGANLSELPQDHEAHDLVASYLAQMCHTLFGTCAVETIVLGGGVMQTPGLLGRIAEMVPTIGAGYLPGRERQKILAPALGINAGIIGALLLAEEALDQSDD